MENTLTSFDITAHHLHHFISIYKSSNNSNQSPTIAIYLFTTRNIASPPSEQSTSTTTLPILQHLSTDSALSSSATVDNIGCCSSRERCSLVYPHYIPWIHLQFPTTCGFAEAATLAISSKLLHTSARYARIHETIRSDAAPILANLPGTPVSFKISTSLGMWVVRSQSMHSLYLPH